MSNFKLGIKNYQIIKNAKLEFEPGLNVIVGESNNGKSSILRAIETAIFNIPREGHITLGETASAVGINYNSKEVIWKRDAKAASPVTYRLDKEVLSKLGRGQPEIIANALDIKEIELDDSKLRLNFQKQMSFPFLLDKTPSQLFKFIVQSAEEDNLMDVIGSMKKDLNKSYSDIKAYDSSRESLKQAAQREIARYKTKKKALPYCDKVIELDAEVKRTEALKIVTEAIRKNIKTVNTNDDRLKTIDKTIDPLQISLNKLRAKLDSFTPLNNTVQAISTAEDKLDKNTKTFKENTEALKKYENLTSKLELVERVKTQQASLDGLKVMLEQIKRIEELDKTRTDRYNKIDEGLVNIISMLGKISKTDSLLEVLKKSLDSISTIRMSGKELVSIHKEIVSNISSIDLELEQFPYCPFCKSELKGGIEHEHN